MHLCGMDSFFDRKSHAKDFILCYVNLNHTINHVPTDASITEVFLAENETDKASPKDSFTREATITNNIVPSYAYRLDI